MEDLRFENKTKKLKIVSRERVDDSIRLTLRNEYSKTITAYEVAVSNMTIHTECLTGTDYDEVLLPGDTREETYAIQPDVDKLGVKILAVVFEDGTSDGAPAYISEIRQYRSGMKIQREQSVTLLKTIIDSKRVDVQSSVGNLGVQVTRNSIGEQKKLPYFMSRGLAEEKERFLRLIDELGRRTDDTQQNFQRNKAVLIRLINHYTKTIEQL